MKKALLLFFVFVLLLGCSDYGLIKKRESLLGTIVEITVSDRDKSPQVIKNAINKAFGEIKRVELLLSRFYPESDISRINADACIRPTKVAQETIAILKKAILFSRLSDGAFDITVFPLAELWGIRQNQRKNAPGHKEIQLALEKVGYQHIDVMKREQSIFLGRPEMSLDLGGIAKGYAVDQAITILKEAGIKSALVNAGGDIYCLGQRKKNSNWRIAVQDPRKRGAFLTTLEVKDKAIASSGDYENYIEIRGQKYSHLINPKSGYPSRELPAGVTVLASDCLTADALATSVFILGPVQGVKIINQLDGVEAIIASTKENKLDILFSRGLK